MVLVTLSTFDTEKEVHRYVAILPTRVVFMEEGDDDGFCRVKLEDGTVLFVNENYDEVEKQLNTALAESV